MELTRDPITNRGEGLVSKLTKIIFLIILSIYMVLVFKAKSMEGSELNILFGYPIIAFYIVVILVSVIPIVLETKKKLKKKCSKKTIE